MNAKVVGLINLGERETYIRDLTQYRPLATIPFAGRYCLIDFMLSSMVNSGIDTISILVKDKFHSLNDHLGFGKWWDLDRKTGGLRILYPNIDDETLFQGDLERLADNLIFFEKTKKEHVLLTRSNYIGNIDFATPFSLHEDTDADITLLTKKIRDGRTRVDLLGLDILMKNEGQVFVGRNLGNQQNFDLGMEMYFIKKDVFLEIIYDALESADRNLNAAINNRLPRYKVMTYALSEEILPIHSMQQYYNASLRILNPDYAQELFYRNGKIFTKVKDAPSTIYMKGSEVNNSLVANGCVIEGTVENSIIFRDVHIGKGAVVRNSIIFQGGRIGEDAQINFAILDKRAKVGDGKLLMGDGGLPYFVSKGANL